MDFKLTSDFVLRGDQPQATQALVEGLGKKLTDQALLGVTGSGKTFTMANVIARVNRPALVIAPNKTLAAQLFTEFRELFPENAVEFFISYYDYYQPEAYLPATDTYIEKDASINDEIDRLRHSATRSLLERRDVIIVASVSCIYGIGSPEEYRRHHLYLEVGKEASRDKLLRRLVELQYTRNEIDFHRGCFRSRGDVIEIFPPHSGERAFRIELYGDEVEGISEFDPIRGTVAEKLKRLTVYPGTHYITTGGKLEAAIAGIEAEMRERLAQFYRDNKLLEAQRLEQRTRFDLEMLIETKYCTGIENYSRHLDGRAPGEPPYTLIDYFPGDFLLFIDESHITVPQLGGMYRGDRSRKENLVEYGFRLPSALDNRPLQFEEFRGRINQVIYVSATPGDYELKQARNRPVEQIIRPTGLIDPPVEVRPAKNQVLDLFGEIKKQVERKERTLVTTLTKRMAEDLTEYYRELGIKVRYLHSEILTFERSEILRDLRLGQFDVLIGINLLREGLDLPEVSLVAILDADKEGFLRSARSLIQTFGRTARNLNGRVILYADKVTGSMQTAIRETERRRIIQEEYNRREGLTPETIQKSITDIRRSIYEADYYTVPLTAAEAAGEFTGRELRVELRREMVAAAVILDFERAAELRDRIHELESNASLKTLRASRKKKPFKPPRRPGRKKT